MSDDAATITEALQLALDDCDPENDMSPGQLYLDALAAVGRLVAERDRFALIVEMSETAQQVLRRDDIIRDLEAELEELRARLQHAEDERCQGHQLEQDLGGARGASSTAATCPGCGEAAGNNYFDRSICPEPCGSMHTRCAGCGASLDGCPWDAAEVSGGTTTGSARPPDPDLLLREMTDANRRGSELDRENEQLEARVALLEEAIDRAMYALNPNQGERPDPSLAGMWLRTTLPEDHPNYIARAALAWVTRKGGDREDHVDAADDDQPVR